VLALAVRSVGSHVLLSVVAFGTGMAVFVPLLRPDVVGGQGRVTSQPLFLLAAAIGYSGWHVSDPSRTYARGWFTDLAWSWADPVADQRLAGGLMAAVALGLLALGAALVVKARRAA
jgi:hypothetical protein